VGQRAKTRPRFRQRFGVLEGEHRDPPRARYTTESGSYYEPLLHFGRNDGSVRYPLYDGIGTVRRLADQAGALTDSYTLDTFGRQISVTGTTPNPYRFGGAWGYIADPSGMLHLGVRFYWPEVGRFGQRDRIRNAELSYQYAYVADNPLRLIDADGRTPYWLSPDPGEREAYAQEALKACKDHARENFTDCLCHSGLPLVAGGGLSIGGVLVGKAKQAAAGLIGGPVAGGVIAAGGAISLGLGAYNAAACFQAQAMEKESCDAAYRWVVNYNATASGQ